MGGSWASPTTRRVAADGTIHYYLRLMTWTGFWAKLDGAASHGRIGTARYLIACGGTGRC